jgi:hypothetical protein
LTNRRLASVDQLATPIVANHVAAIEVAIATFLIDLLLGISIRGLLLALEGGSWGRQTLEIVLEQIPHSHCRRAVWRE